MPLLRKNPRSLLASSIKALISRGFSPSAAIAASYQSARRRARVAGDLAARSLLVGAALPADIAKMNESQAFKELTRLDALSATRKLTSAEFKRLTDLELRMEEFVNPSELEKAAEYLKQLEAGNKQYLAEQALKNAQDQKVLDAYKGPVQSTEGFTIKDSGMRVILPVIAVGLVLTLSKMKKRR